MKAGDCLTTANVHSQWQMWRLEDLGPVWRLYRHLFVMQGCELQRLNEERS